MARDPDRAFLVDDQTTLSFREVDEVTARIAAGLQQFESIGHCAVYSPNDSMAFACVLGAVRAGSTWIAVNVRNSVEWNVSFLRKAACDVLFYHSSLAQEAEAILSQVDGIRLAICIDEEPATATAQHISLSTLKALRSGPPREVPDDPDRVVMLASTGGTTGEPKAVQHSERVWQTVIGTFWTCCPIGAPPVHLAVGPMTHGAGGLALMMMCGGTTNVILRKADPVAIMETIQRHRVTHMYLPPTLIYALLDHPEVSRYDFSSLKYLVVSASPIAPDKLREALDVFGDALCQAYGQAEAPMFLTFLSNQDLRGAVVEAGNELPRRFASCGRPTINTLVEVMNEAGELLPTGEKGEIVARGNMIFAGYFNDRKATEEVSHFGWHHTGDIGYRDDEGFYYIVDRKKDMIITGGFNVFSAEVENVIHGHPCVLECAVVGVPDAKWGEAVKAVVQLKSGQSASAEEIIAMVKAKLGGVYAPKSVEFWPQLPRSSNNKVLKAEVRRRFWAGTSRAVG
ncbi:MAG: AMP-binding protein [Pseudomonadota bacterium]